MINNLFNYAYHPNFLDFDSYSGDLDDREEEYRRQYQAALEQERHRQHRAAVEQERRRRNQAAYRAAIKERMYHEEMQRRRQQRLYELHMAAEREKQQIAAEERRNRAVAAAAARKKKAEKVKEERGERHEQMQQQSKPRNSFDIVHGADGRLYRIVRNPTSTQDIRHDITHLENMFSDFEHEECGNDSNARPSSDKNVDLAPMERAPVINNEIHNINIIHTSENKKSEKKSPRPRTDRNKKKPSLLIGEVEDASDSECEDKFADVWHNRRPSPGNWIEPVEL